MLQRRRGRSPPKTFCVLEGFLTSKILALRLLQMRSRSGVWRARLVSLVSRGTGSSRRGSLVCPLSRTDAGAFRSPPPHPTPAAGRGLCPGRSPPSAAAQRHSLDASLEDARSGNRTARVWAAAFARLSPQLGAGPWRARQDKQPG